MSCVFCIETSTSVCSIALSEDRELIYYRESKEKMSHASLLGVFVKEGVEFVQKQGLRIHAVAVSTGPGSYTGLRIGVSEAKGLCYGWEVPLIAVSTLEIMGYSALQSTYKTDYFCPMIDARRMEVYTALYDYKMNEVSGVKAEIIGEDSFQDILKRSSVLFLGNGAEKCKTVIHSENAYFAEDLYPQASSMIGLAEEAYMSGNFVDLAYFEPFYLKDFMATQPKNKL